LRITSSLRATVLRIGWKAKAYSKILGKSTRIGPNRCLLPLRLHCTTAAPDPSLVEHLNPDPEIRESSSSSCSSSIYWASAPRKEPIFLAIILFRLGDGENSRRRVTWKRAMAGLMLARGRFHRVAAVGRGWGRLHRVAAVGRHYLVAAVDSR